MIYPDNGQQLKFAWQTPMAIQDATSHLLLLCPKRLPTHLYPYLEKLRTQART